MTRSAGSSGFLAHSDTWLGLGLFALGGVAARMASGFDAMSRSYPLALAVAVMAFGAILIVRAIVAAPKSVSFALPARVAGLATLLIVVWIAALSFGFGFVLPTLLMQGAFLVLCGVRPLGRVLAYAVVITAVGYGAFVLGLGVRLPDTLAPWLL